MPDTIRTERLLLRRARPDDLAAMHAVLSNPAAMRWWSSLPHETEAETEEWLARMVAAPADVSDDFIVEQGGVVIGKCGAWRLPEIGFIFDPAMQGQGFASEALAAFVAWRFARGSDHLTADVDPANTASLKLLTRNGFHITHRAARTWLIGGVWHDSVYLRRDAPQSPGNGPPPNTRASTAA